MSSYGLTEAGFILPSYDDIFTNYVTKTKLSFGTDIATSEDSIMGQLLGIIAYQDQTVWEAIQMVYNSQTLNGAEGIYLDDILSKRGLIRKSASPGSGFAFVATTQAAAWTFVVDENYYFTGNNNITYEVSTETKLMDRVGAFKLSRNSVTSFQSLTFSMKSATTGALNSITLNPSASTFLSDLSTFIQNNVVEEDTSKVFVDTTTNTLYMGFSQNNKTSPLGLSTAVTFYADQNVGNKWSLIPVVATEDGYNSLSSGQINSISSTPPGYLGVGNFTAFNPGTDVETDAEYRARFNDNLDEANAATRPAIYKAVSDLDGVTKVRIYDNPTSTDTPEAKSFTFNTVVEGGVAEDIARTIYEKKPINTQTDGTVSYNIPTADGSVETIRFTPASIETYSVKVQYQTVDGKALNVTEQNAVKNALTVLQTQFEIGTRVFNAQLQGTVFSAVPYGRLSSLVVFTKKTSEPDSSYNTNDIVPPASSRVLLDIDDVSFEQLP